jgi:hypothetical protein
LSTKYIFKEEEMGHIMVNWDVEWNIPPIGTKTSNKKKMKIHKVDEDEEEGDD